MVMSIETQLSVFLPNKAGVLAQVCQALADAKVNIKALTLVDSQEHGVLRLVVEDGKSARQVLRDLNVPLNETEVLAVEMANRPGAMADVCTRLANKHININYAYCTTGTRGGKTVGIFKVADLKKAMSVLQQRTLSRKTPTRQVRARPAAR